MDDPYLFERDNGADSDSEDDDTDSVASDDEDRDDKDDDKQSLDKEEQRKEHLPKSEKEDPTEDDKHDDDTDDDDEDDEVTYKKTDDISGKLTNVSISDFLVGINAGNNTKLSTRCVRALSWPEIV